MIVQTAARPGYHDPQGCVPQLMQAQVAEALVRSSCSGTSDLTG